VETRNEDFSLRDLLPWRKLFLASLCLFLLWALLVGPIAQQSSYLNPFLRRLGIFFSHHPLLAAWVLATFLLPGLFLEALSERYLTLLCFVALFFSGWAAWQAFSPVRQLALLFDRFLAGDFL